MNRENQQNQLEEQFGIIVMLDALGISSYSLDQCRAYIDKQNKIRKDLERKQQSLEEYNFFKNASTAIFGDTIVICFPITESDNTPKISILAWISWYLGSLIHLGIHNQILLRGCISIGKYIKNENIVLGPAIFDAHDWYESADWFGIIYSPKSRLWIDSEIEKEKLEKKDDSLLGLFELSTVKYKVPLVRNRNEIPTKEFWAIAWPSFYSSQKPHLGKFGFLTEELFEMPMSKEGESKFQNSIDFFKWYEKESLIKQEKLLKENRIAIEPNPVSNCDHDRDTPKKTRSRSKK